MAENCTAQPAQPLHAARRAGPRRARRGASTSTRRSSSSRPHRHRVRQPPLAALGRGGRRRLPREAARPLQVHPRPDACASPNHGLTMEEIAEELAAAGRRCATSSHCRELLRHRQPQREGRVPALPRLVRRQPGRTCTRTRRWRPPAATSSTWAAPRPCSTRARQSFDGGRLPLGRRGGEPRGVRRSRQPTRPASCRPTRSSSSATRPSRARGATST